jgi:hypothetical protein
MLQVASNTNLENTINLTCKLRIHNSYRKIFMTLKANGV